MQAYVKLHGLADSKNEYYNNLFEYGPGISWQPFNYQPINFVLNVYMATILKTCLLIQKIITTILV